MKDVEDVSTDPFNMGVTLPPGLLTVDDQKLLRKYAEGKDLVVELGTYKGRGSALMSLFAKKVVTIDFYAYTANNPELTLENTKKNLKDFPNVKAIKEVSWEAARHFPGESIDVLFQDAAHSSKGVVMDYDAYYPKVKAGGYIIIHDYKYMDGSVGADRDVKGGVEEILNKGEVHDVEESGWCKVLRKPPRSPQAEKVLSEGWISTKDVVNKALFLGDECIRYDILVRYVGAAGYSRTGIMPPIYDKLQRLRLMLISKDPRAYVDPERFPKTINSMKEKGFDEKSPIIIGSDSCIIEGAHRLAVCIALNIPRLYFVMWDRKGGQTTYPWFEDNFTVAELKVINETKGMLHERFR